MRLVKLKSNGDFRRLYHRGKAFVTPFFVLYVMPNRKNGGIRLGITVGKKIGGAVQRNRAKRVITAAVRSLTPQIRAGYDLVIVARTRILGIKSTVAADCLKTQLRAAKIWCENETDQ